MRGGRRKAATPPSFIAHQIWTGAAPPMRIVAPFVRAKRRWLLGLLIVAVALALWSGVRYSGGKLPVPTPGKRLLWSSGTERTLALVITDPPSVDELSRILAVTIPPYRDIILAVHVWVSEKSPLSQLSLDFESHGVSVVVHKALRDEPPSTGQLRACVASLEDFCYFWGEKPRDFYYPPQLRAMMVAVAASSGRIVRLVHPKIPFATFDALEGEPHDGGAPHAYEDVRRVISFSDALVPRSIVVAAFGMGRRLELPPDAAKDGFLSVYLNYWTHHATINLEAIWWPTGEVAPMQLEAQAHHTAFFRDLHRHQSHAGRLADDTTVTLLPAISSLELLARAPCWSDQCLFLVSVRQEQEWLRILHTQHYFSQANSFDTRHSDVVTNMKRYAEHPGVHAVDGNDHTYWTSLYDVGRDDFFGLRSLDGELTAVYLKAGHTFQSDLQFEVSDDGAVWTTPSGPCAWNVTEIGRYYRYSGPRDASWPRCTHVTHVRFRSIRSYDGPFVVYELQGSDPQCVFGPTPDMPASIAASVRELRAAMAANETAVAERLSAVLLNWKRACNLRAIVALLFSYPFIGEVIVWNNNLNMTLSEEAIFPLGLPAEAAPGSLRVLNLRNNTHDFAKYAGCSMARHKYCYLQDDDWVNLYPVSQYHQFLRFPQHIHSYTIPIIHLEQQCWRLYNREIGLHAGFTWLGLGSIFPRSLAIEFLRKVDIVGSPVLQVDMLFAYFSNNYPYQLAMRGHQLDQTGAWSSTVDHWAILYNTMGYAADVLFDHLANNTGLFDRNELSPPYASRDVRCACHDDRCLFFTSVSWFPDPSAIKYERNMTVRGLDSLYSNAVEGFPNNLQFDKGNYFYAVDGDLFTAWRSAAPTKPGDSFGLDLLYTRTHSEITIVCSQPLDMFSVSVSRDGHAWRRVDLSVPQSFTLTAGLTLHELLLSSPPPFRFIRFVANERFQDAGLRVEVYDLRSGWLPRDEIPIFGVSVYSGAFLERRPVGQEKLTVQQWREEVALAAAARAAAASRVSRPDGVVGPVNPVEGPFSSWTVDQNTLLISTMNGGAFYVDGTITLSQTRAAPLLITCRASAEGFVQTRNLRHAPIVVVVDALLQDGEWVRGAAQLPFSAGTHGPELQLALRNFYKPVHRIVFSVNVKNGDGLVMVEDLAVAEQVNYQAPT